MAEIGRLLTAMVTPFDDDGEINYKKARKLATALINSGSDGLVIGGTTGDTAGAAVEILEAVSLLAITVALV